MIIGSRHNLNKIIDSDPIIKIEDQLLNRVYTTKSHGVFNDERLGWENQIDSTTKKISNGIGAIRLIKPFVAQKRLMQICNALVQPYFDYCSLVLQNCNITLQSKCQKLQERAARVITGDNWEISSKDILDKLHKIIHLWSVTIWLQVNLNSQQFIYLETCAEYLCTQCYGNPK